MRFLCALLLICLVAAGPAAAIAISPAQVAATIKVTPAVQYVTLVPAKITSPQTTTAVPGQAPLSPMLSVSSEPSGAAVSVNGVAKGNTPLTLGLYPGTYTVVITLAGYRDYTTTVTLKDSDRVAVDAQLQPALNAGALVRNISAVSTIAPGLRLNRTIVQATVTTPAPNTVCLSGQSCLTDADAYALFGPGSAYNVNEICGYAVSSDNQMIPKHCVAGNLGPNTTFNCLSGQHCLTLAEAGDTLAAGWYYLEGQVCGWEGTAYSPVPKYCISGLPKGSGLQPGVIQSVAVINPGSLVPVPLQTTSTTTPGATKKPLGGKRQIGIMDSFIGYIGNIFVMQPVCPQNLTACSGKCVFIGNAQTCDGKCTDTSIDTQNCGACDYACDPVDAYCYQGQCVEIPR